MPCFAQGPFSSGTDMKRFDSRGLLSSLCIAAILAAGTNITAGPVTMDQVVQVVNARPGKADVSMFTRLHVANDYNFLISATDDDEDKKKGAPQDGRVITTTTTDIVQDDVCDCVDEHRSRGFPKWALLGLAAIPIAFILIKKKQDTPTPTGTVPFTSTPTSTPTGTPTGSPTGTPTMTPTVTPTPPEPVPEPMTILLFGTGLASIGMAARRRFGKKGEPKEDTDEE
jgi:hypothetical protein